MRQVAQISGVIALVIALAVAVYVVVAPGARAPAVPDGELFAQSTYGCLVYREQGCDKLVVASGGELEAESGATVTIADLYPVLAESSRELYCSSATVTGTLAVDDSTHGIASPAAAIAQLGSAPGVSAGDPFIAYAVRSGSTVTLTVVQDDGNAATAAATVDYCVFGD